MRNLCTAFLFVLLIDEGKCWFQDSDDHAFGDFSKYFLVWKRVHREVGFCND
jgi:hypothetical protein